MNIRTRYKLTLFAAVFLALITLLAIGAKMETVATASIAGIMTILSAYMWSQTTRPSPQENAFKSNKKQRIPKSSVTDIFAGSSNTPVQK
jgi:hypothetical protein